MKHRKADNLKNDCFAFRGVEFKEFCSALSGKKNCIGCKFYKSRTRMLLEEKRTEERLKRLGR